MPDSPAATGWFTYLMIKLFQTIPGGKRTRLRRTCWLLTIFLLLAGALLPVAAQNPSSMPPLALKTDPLPITPKEYYITEVLDERPDRKGIAYLIPAGATAQSVPLQGGDVPALQAFFRKALPRNPNLRPVVLRLRECRVTETATGKGMVNGEVVVAIRFDVQQGEKTEKLVEYRGGVRYGRSPNQLSSVESALRQSLAGSLQYFDKWMNENAEKNTKLAKGVKLVFADYTRNPVGDTVFYDPARPLIWDDFRDTPRPGPYAASVFPGFAHESHDRVANGVIEVKVLMKVFVVKSASWVREGAKDAYTLNHEQRHFDIARIVSERYKRKLTAEKLTVEDYDHVLGYEFLESYREMNRLQEQYDGETQHGLNKVAQQRWNQRIEAELKSYSIKR